MMEIEQRAITVRDLVAGYQDNADEGVVGYGGKLDIRPPYQREFVYDGNQRAAVIDSLTKKFPLNVMYWVVKGDGDFEVLDGQQRTIAICQYVNNEFSAVVGGFPENRYFANLQDEEQQAILDYELMVYHCSGTDKEKLEWFKIINIAGVKLTDQELKNAVYSGPWVTDAKQYFSKTSGPAHDIGARYLVGSPIRQEYLETAIKWASNDSIDDYMGKHQHDSDAKPLWDYFQAVINWIEETFTQYRKEMKGLPWGSLYAEHKDKKITPSKMEAEVSRLMEDEDVTSKKGIYTYVFTGDENLLNIRAFKDSHKREAYERQKGICVHCNKHFPLEKMEGDHITPWSKGGKTEADNCQMLCKPCNRTKSNK